MVTLMVFIIGFIFLTSLGLFSFEATRANAARDELRSACEAAALAGAAALTSSDSTDTTTSHNNSIAAAQQAFVANSIVGTTLAGADFSSMTASNYTTYGPSSEASALFIEFLDPNSTPVGQPVPNLADPKGRIVHCVAAYGLQPVFGKFLGIDNTPIRSEASSRVPSLDVVMLFDVSGSIDDQTPVTCVRRMWNAGKAQNSNGSGSGAIDYVKTSTTGGSPAGAVAEGRMWDIIQCWSVTGMDWQGTPPQNLDESSWVGSYPVNFSPALRSAGAEVGTPPGNCPPGGASTGNAQTYTDMVVNIDGNKIFAGTTIGPYRFPDAATLVEAARGNLEDNTVYTNSKAKVSLPDPTITPMAGYQSTYLTAAHAHCMPIGAAQQAATSFFQIMNNNTNAHFGFMSFGSGISTGSNTTSGWNVSSTYAAGGTGSYPFVGTKLDYTSSQYTQVLADIPQTLANGCTDVGDALQEAYNELKKGSGLSRNDAKKFVILFTDGQRTCGPANASTFTIADNCRTEGIAAYTIGMAQNAGIIPGECNLLNEGAGKTISYTDPITMMPGSYTPGADGIAAHAGNGGKFFLVTNTANLRYVFENIARQLVQLGKS